VIRYDGYMCIEEEDVQKMALTDVEDVSKNGAGHLVPYVEICT
jgi:hypothetical protein